MKLSQNKNFDREISAFVAADDIDIGVSWELEINTALSDCDVFIPILTVAACRSNWVQKEIRVAIEKETWTIPCMYNQVSPTEIPAIIVDLQRITSKNEYDLARQILALFIHSENDQRIKKPPKIYRVHGEVGVRIWSRATTYVVNEAMRDLIEIISRSGLSLGYLLSSKESYVKAISLRLKEQTLTGIELKIIDESDGVIDRWIFEVRYESNGLGIIEFSVEDVIWELKDYSKYGISYRITLISDRSASDLPGWIRSDRNESPSGRYICSFGHSPIEVNIKRYYQ